MLSYTGCLMYLHTYRGIAVLSLYYLRITKKSDLDIDCVWDHLPSTKPSFVFRLPTAMAGPSQRFGPLTLGVFSIVMLG
jgi:hypothetical protein